MNLQPDLNAPGRWRNTDWAEGEPGTFALIIGVSHYLHLDKEGKSYSLGQLYVSALTAYRFFCWLRDGYLYTGCPLAKCWLLLSPTDAEIAAESHLTQHLQQPTYQNCEDAILDWYSTMALLPKNGAEQSRAFFFFSGHGLEINANQQILLPCDYLRPPVSQLNRALSTVNLHQGLASLEVPRQVFLVDACRNDNQALKAATITGSPILNEWQVSLTNPKRVAPLIHSTISGSQAWQPTSPSEGTSLFGQALLEGLQAPKSLTLDCDHFDPCAIKIYTLLPFMQERLTQLLKDRSATVQQTISSSDLTEDLPITQVPPGGPPRADLPLTTTLVELSKTLDIPAGWQPTLPEFYDGATMHTKFGSEVMTNIWLGARIYSLSQHKWLDEPGKKAYALHKIEHGAGTQAYRFVLSIPDSPGHHWLELNDGSQVFACVLPGDEYAHPRFTLEINFEYQQLDEHGLFVRGRWISSLVVSLARDNQGPLNRAANLWEKYSRLNVTEALQELDAQQAETLVYGKVESPLAATVAAIVLLRASRPDQLHDWLRNLANWFPDRPDGPVLWVEQLLRQNPTSMPSGEAANWLLQLQERGLPHTSEALGYAVQQIRSLFALATLEPSQQSQLVDLQQRLDTAMRFFRPAGLFSVFSANDGTLTPRIVEGRLPGQ